MCVCHLRTQKMNKGEFQICPFITKNQKQKQSPMEAKGNVNTSYCTENK